MMRILIVGALSDYAIERHYLDHLKSKNAEVDVRVFACQNYFLDYYHKSILNKFIFRLGYKRIFHRISLLLRAEIESYKPDVLFVFKGMEILPQTLKWAKMKGIKLVNYNPDNPFLFSGFGSGNSNITDAIGLYDLHLTYDDRIKEQLEREMRSQVKKIPFGFELSESTYEECRKEDEVLRLCFLGNPDKSRASFIMQLLEAGIPVDVYGHKWQRFIDHSEARIYDPVYHVDFWRVLRKYRVQLNLMRVHNPFSHNMRSFEIPAIGGIMLAPDTVDHQRFFNNGTEAILYSGVKDCIAKAKRVLSLSLENANEYRDAARLRSISSGYSYSHRAEQAFKAIEELMNEA
jgi:spore maturation protein CgeB